MSNESIEKENRMLVFLTGFIRIQHVSFWFAASFFGFLLGITTLSLNLYIVPFVVFAISMFCILSFTFAINNYYDADSDRENPRRKHINAIASGKISKKNGILLIIMFVLISLIVTILYKFEVFLFCVFLLFLGWAYSVPLLRTKSIPVLDIIWHFLGFFSYVIWGSLITGSIDIINWLVAISIGIFSCIGQVWNHINDYSFDKDSGITTFAVWGGLKTANVAFKIIVLIHIIVLIPLILLYSLSYLSTIIILILGVFIGLFVLKPKKDSFPSMAFYLQFGIGGAVYLSVLIYHINILLGEPTIGLLNSISII
jgi:4-hydroxybenzoate polyprenyltransferase